MRYHEHKEYTNYSWWHREAQLFYQTLVLLRLLDTFQMFDLPNLCLVFCFVPKHPCISHSNYTIWKLSERQKVLKIWIQHSRLSCFLSKLYLLRFILKSACEITLCLRTWSLSKAYGLLTKNTALQKRSSHLCIDPLTAKIPITR